MTESDPREVGRLIALRFLEAKPRTEAELYGALCQRGIPEDVASELVVRFVTVGLVDDRAYARLWVESRMRSRGLGATALRQELRRHHVPDALIEEALADVEPEDSLAAAVVSVRGRVARCPLPLSYKDERRLLAFLMRRGHSGDTARQAVRMAVDEVAEAS
ncbi:MAG: regulatory protein RecX [Candidatus Nanopelagicales bacterium]